MLTHGLKVVFFFLFMVLGTKVFAADIINIYIISDKNFRGDRNNLLGVANHTKEYFKKHHQQINIYEHQINNLEVLKHNILISKNHSIILSCGVYGIDAISYLKSHPGLASKSIAVHLSHQILNSSTAKHDDLIQKENNSGADLIVLPSHVLDDATINNMTSAKTKIIPTIGISHNMSLSDIENTYKKEKHLLPVSAKYLGIILSGDAMDSNGQMHYYTTEEVYKLGKQIVNLAQKEQYTVLISNGPRTGKHDIKTGREMKVHQAGIIDPVTQKFIDILKVNKIKFKLFDFQKDRPRHKKLIYAAVLKTPGSKMLVPGDSTSTISESVDLLPYSSIIIYYNPSMNKENYNHVRAEFENGRASIMDLNMNIKHPINKAKNIDLAGKIVAKAIYKLADEFSKPLSKQHNKKSGIFYLLPSFSLI
jgi:hypothetical protein